MNHPAMLRDAQPAGTPGAGYAPVPPISLEQTGLPFFFLVELAAKILFKGGPQRQGELVDRIHLLHLFLLYLLLLLYNLSNLM